MAEIITAVYENGVLRPLSPHELKERQTVRLQILPDAAADEREEIIRLLVTSGLTRPASYAVLPPDPISSEERKKLADRLGSASGKPLSEITIEERDHL